jgi:hypothetical protein
MVPLTRVSLTILDLIRQVTVADFTFTLHVGVVERN